MEPIVILTPKNVSSDIIYTFDFPVPAGETITSAITGMTVYSGTDASPGSMISGSPSISGSRISQKVIDGLEGVVYQMTCAAILSGGAQLIQAGQVAVIPFTV